MRGFFSESVTRAREYSIAMSSLADRQQSLTQRPPTEKRPSVDPGDRIFVRKKSIDHGDQPWLVRNTKGFPSRLDHPPPLGFKTSTKRLAQDRRAFPADIFLNMIRRGFSCRERVNLDSSLGRTRDSTPHPGNPTTQAPRADAHRTNSPNPPPVPTPTPLQHDSVMPCPDVHMPFQPHLLARHLANLNLIQRADGRPNHGL